MTTRNMGAAAISAAITQSGASVHHLVQIGLSSSSLYIATGEGDVQYSGSTYSAIGGTLALSPIVESWNSPPSFNIMFSGVDTTVLSAAATDYTIGHVITVYRYYTINGAWQGDAFVLAKGYMNGEWTHQKDMITGKKTLSIGISSKLDIGKQIRGIKTNLQAHQKYYAGDNFYKWTFNIGTNQGIVIPSRYDDPLILALRNNPHPTFFNR